jgi:pyruvate-ferredoxin/flavodoxin oxidoreductase
MNAPLQHQKAAVDSGQWLLYRYNPELTAEGKNPMTLDSKAPKIPVADYLNMETRFKMLSKSRPETAKELFKLAQDNLEERFKFYTYLAQRSEDGNGKAE